MILEGKNLSKKYNQSTVVNNVSLHIKTGEIVGLFGANGAGKTTSFMMIAGLVTPDAGTIKINNTNVTRYPLCQRAHMGLRYLPQESSIFQTLSVEDNLFAIAELFYTQQECDHLVSSLLKDFRLTAVRKKKGNTLSGGQRRRVEIARTLIGNPSFVLFDEPLAGVDPKSIRDIALLMHKLAEKNIGILVTDHNVKDLLPFVHRAYVMHDGSLLRSGTPQEIIQDPNVRSSYLGTTFPEHIDTLHP